MTRTGIGRRIPLRRRRCSRSITCRTAPSPIAPCATDETSSEHHVAEPRASGRGSGLSCARREEFPGLGRALAEPLERRQILKLMAAAFVMAGLGGCDTKFGENLIPSRQDSSRISSRACRTSMRPRMYSTGLPRESSSSTHGAADQSRKETSKHPASLGAIGVFAQAQLLDFYDPDRAAQISTRGAPSDDASLRSCARRRAHAPCGEPRSRASGFDRYGDLAHAGGGSSMHCASNTRKPNGSNGSRSAAMRCGRERGSRMGSPSMSSHSLIRSMCFSAIESDLLSTAPGHLRYARDFASRRNPSRCRDHEPSLRDRIHAHAVGVGGRSSLYCGPG